MPRDWPDPRFPEKRVSWIEIALAVVAVLLVPVGAISLVRHVIAMLRTALLG